MNRRKFSPRLSEKALIKKTYDKIKNTGMEKSVQAILLLEMLKLVQSTDNPHFISLRARPKVKYIEPWVHAYTLIFRFLEDLKMNSTIAAIYFELNSKQRPIDKTLFNDITPIDYFSRLLHYKQLPFTERVNQPHHTFKTILSPRKNQKADLVEEIDDLHNSTSKGQRVHR